MSDWNGFSLKPVRVMMRTYSLYKYVYRRQRLHHLSQNLAF